MELPKLRKDIQLFPATYQGKKGLMAKDLLGLIPKPVLLQGELLEIFSLVDGQRNIQDMQLELVRRRGGVLVSSDEVKSLIQELDSVFLLDSEYYRQEKKRFIREYSLLEVRKASHAGLSYPAEPEKLRSYLVTFFPPGGEPFPQLKDKKIKALISPHIDLEAGRKIYTKAFSAIKDSNPQRVFLLGTGHSLDESFVCLTEKDFETPLGRVKTDKDCVGMLREAGRDVVSADEMAHRNEHSLEFQLLFLQFLFGSGFFLVPLLFGSFHRVLEEVSRPSEIPGMDSFIEALSQSLAQDRERTLVVAGVDFSHVGPKFGHDRRAQSMLLEVKEHDRKLIDAACRGEVKPFWSEAKRVKDRYNVCGFSTMACLLELLPGHQGHLLDYSLWQEESTQSAVSFAALVFE